MIVLKLLWGFAALSLFPIKLLIGELLFSHYFTRCAHFKVRIAVSIVLQSVLSFGLYSTLSLTNSWLLSNTFFYFLEFGISVLLLKLLFRESYTELLSAAVASYMTEHTATQVFELLFGWTKAGLPQGDTLSLLLYASTQILLFVLTSLGVWLVFAKNAEPVSGSRELKRNMTLLSAATLIVVLFLSSVRDAFALESYALMVITRLFSIFCCLTLLYLRYSILDKSRAEHERAELERVVELERKQIEQSKENIELINIKCHDLRHRIDLWEQRGADVDAKEIGEVKRMIGFYDSAIHTGNDILDTILTERSLYCEKEGIRLSVIADGEKLGFLSA
ncbi:MAG: hypothetical protein Q4A88_05045, partial [Clostridia bacterium]|nr:hypothetical protein [Clostridia bacterium]